MVSLIEINEAINNKIEAAISNTEFKDIPIVAEEVTDIIRPSFKVRIENSKNGKFNASCKERTLTVRVYFFASDRKKYKIENLKMQDLIENCFLDGLKVTDNFFIPIEEVESEIIDTVLECSFDLYSVELLPEETVSPIGEPIEDMEELILKLRRN